jgi:hypothetical protein
MKSDTDMSHELACRILFVAVILHAVVLMEFMRGDLWFDELITVAEFVMLRDHRAVFTTYPVANNHMLFSFMEWWWVTGLAIIQGTNVYSVAVNAAAPLLRLPCAFFACLTGVFLYTRGRRSLGNARALVLAIVLLASPMFLSFAYQIRGYGLSMLLSSIAAIGTLEILRGKRKEGAFIYGPSAAFLPVVIPSNVLVTFSLWLFVAIVLLRRRCDFRNLFFVGAMGLVSACGMIVYLLIFDKFMKVVKQTGGWDSGGDVVGHLALALAIHLGGFLLACWATRMRTPQTEREAPNALLRLLPILALCCAVPILALALGRAPFPRVFLSYLPPLTLCAMWFFRAENCRRMRDFAMVLFMVLTTSIVWYRFSAYTAQRDLQQGVTRQNLLQQFYARRTDVSGIVDFLVHYEGVPQRALVWIDVHDFPSLRYYWRRKGQIPQRLECLNGGTLLPLNMSPEAYLHVPQVIVTHNPEKAVQDYTALTGLTPIVEQIYTRTAIGIYRVVAISDPSRPVKRPRFPLDDPI